MVKRHALRVGDRVTVPWGLDEEVTGRVTEIWGDPPAQVRVELDLPHTDPTVLLLNPDIVKRVA